MVVRAVEVVFELVFVELVFVELVFVELVRVETVLLVEDDTPSFGGIRQE